MGWRRLAHDLHHRGVEVLGYVYTEQGRRPEPAVAAWMLRPTPEVDR